MKLQYSVVSNTAKRQISHAFGTIFLQDNYSKRINESHKSYYKVHVLPTILNNVKQNTSLGKILKKRTLHEKKYLS